MKKIINLMMVVCTLHLSGCKENSIGEPIVIMLYFSFVTAEGGDFFESDERYDVSKVTFSCRLITHVDIANDVSVFETTYPSCESIVDFGNGDRDTLKVEWLPRDYGDTNFEAEKLEQVIFTYNDVIIDTWTFDPDLKFFRELTDRNAIKFDDVRSGNPIIIMIPKTADEDELD